MKGIIVKGIAGFYYVKVGDKIIECKLRGKFRYDNLTPMIGDKVDISINNGNGDGVIEKIYKRSTELIRPAVANVNQAIIVFSVKKPEVNIDLLNKFLINCEYNDLKIIVCFNKIDLEYNSNDINEIVDMLSLCNYNILFLNAKENIGLDKLKENLKGNISVFCGPSGVGKSTILNKIIGHNVMETGEVSEKLGRGKHTTRHSELIDIGDGLVIDTPGFSMLNINYIEKSQLQYYFPEFKDYIYKCKYRGCLHYKEDHCAVKDAVKDKKISDIRYKFYVSLIEKTNDTRRYKK